MEPKNNFLTYQTLFDLSPEAIVLLDNKGKLLDVNQRLYDWLGYSPEEVINKTLMRLPFLPAKSKVKVMSKFLGRLSGKKIEPYKLEFKAKNGEDIVGLVRAEVIKDDNGKAIADLVMISEITQQDKYDRELGRYKTIIENIDNLVTITDASGNYLLVNDAFAQFVGLSKSEIIGKKINQVFNEETASKVFQNDRTKLNEEYEESISINSRRYVFRTTAFLFEEKDTGVKGIIKVRKDITDKKELSERITFLADFEELLANTSKEFISLNSSQTDAGIDLLLTRIGEFLDADRAYLFKFDWAQDIMFNSHEWVRGGVSAQKSNLQNMDLDNFKWWVETLKTEGKIIIPNVDAMDENLNYIKKTLQDQKIQSLVCVPVNIGFRMIGFLGIDSVVETKVFDKKLQQLLQLAADMVSNLLERKEIDQSKNDFVSIASHQLRTPLTAINWNIELMTEFEDTPFSEEQREMMLNVAKSSKRMVLLVNSLLNVSRLESGRMSISISSTRLADLVEDLQKSLENELKEKDLKIELKGKVSEIKVDAELIAEAIKNLLTNAIKYAHNGTKIKVELKQDSTHQRISIENEGIGIPPHQKPYIFTKFFRADNALKAQADGTGLGLYFTKLIVLAHEGEIDFESELGKKTKFEIKLPFKAIQSKKGAVNLASSANL